MTDDMLNERRLIHATEQLEMLIRLIRSGDTAELRMVVTDPDNAPVLMLVKRGDEGEITDMMPIAEFLGFMDQKFVALPGHMFTTTILNTEEESKCLMDLEESMGEILEPSAESFFVSSSESRH